MPVKPRWTDRALKSAALVAVSLLFGVVYASSESSRIGSVSTGIAALNSGRSSGLTHSAPGAVGQSAAALAPGSHSGATPGSTTSAPSFALRETSGAPDASRATYQRPHCSDPRRQSRDIDSRKFFVSICPDLSCLNVLH